MITEQRVLALVVVFLVLACDVSTACRCQLQKPAITYCLSHWTARATIEEIHENTTNPAFVGFNDTDVRYKVKFLEIFKAPKELNGTSFIDVYTPEEEASCGLLLEKGEEYLLSGRYINKTLISTLCGQILFEDRNKSILNDILTWNEVPEETVKSLRSHAFDAKCR